MNFKQDDGFVSAVTKCSDNIQRFINGLNLGRDPLGKVKSFPVDWGLLSALGCRMLDGNGQFFRVLDFYNENLGAVQHGAWRSYEEQEKLFAIGRSIGYKKVYGADYVNNPNLPDCLRSKWTYEKQVKKIGPVVTNCRGGESYHNYGLAVDIVLRHYGESVPKGKVSTVDGVKYDTLRKVYEGSGLIKWAECCNLEWGGYWSDFPDPAHFQDKGYDIIPYKLYGQYNLRNEKNCSFSAVRDFARGRWNKILKAYEQALEDAKDALENGGPIAEKAHELGENFGKEAGERARKEILEDWQKTKNWLPVLGVLAGGLFCLYFFFGTKRR